MQDLPEMYRHCKSTEDKDMTLIDFVTDHLVNIDGIFDQHDKGDEQKPHESKPLEHQVQTNTLLISYLVFSIKITLANQIKSAIPSNNFLPSDYVSEIFRPPIA
jgi:hypothetical protein